MRRILPLLVPATVLVLTGCGAASYGGAPDPTGAPAAGEPASDSAGGSSPADDDLRIEVDLGDGSAPETWTLTCGGSAAGSHPAPEAACDHLDAMADPFAPVPDDAVCTQQYGGPETAQVTGRWAGEPVDLELSRVDGCRIAQWDSLVPLVPAPGA